jgi:hypothetical protein
MNARALFTLTTLLAGPAFAQTKGRLNLPEFATLADKASDTVRVTLDSNLLGLAAIPQQRGSWTGGEEACQLADGRLRAHFTFEPITSIPRGHRKRAPAIECPGLSRIVGAQQ